MEFRPTLIIGLGGSGTFVARRLKKRLFRLVEDDIPPSIQILAFDTDAQKADPLLDQLSALEFHRINNFQGDNYVSQTALNNQPYLKDWWQYPRLAPGFVRDGAQQKPPVGRLAFFVKFDSIDTQIRDCVQRIFQRTSKYTPPAKANLVDVHVIGSSCGGTGAGMFFDVAILARDIINQSAREAVLKAHVFLPSCFERTAAEARSLQTNAFAFFKTMEAMQSDRLPPVRYPSRTIESPLRSLFSRVHLLGSVNTAGIKLGEQDIFETAALQLDLEISSASGRDMEGAIDNAQANFDVRPQGRLAVYSSYGAAYLTGTPDFGRLAVLPDFVRSVLNGLATPCELSSARAPAITNPAFVHLSTILADDVAALDLLAGYEGLVMRIKNTEEPERMASQLEASMYSVISGLPTSGLDSLPALNSEVRENACRLIESGEAGISRAIDYLERAKQDLAQAIDAARLAEVVQIESLNTIAGKVSQFFKTKESKKTELSSKGLPYLRAQTLAMVRKSVAIRAKATLSTAVGEVQTCLESLRRFGASASTLLTSVEKDSKEKIAAKQNVLGAQSMAIDIEEVKKSFSKKTNSLAAGFFGSMTAARSLRRLAEGVLGGKGPDVWGANLLQSADEFLRAVLAADSAVPSNWYERAAKQIVDCQPLVQFVPEHANYVAARPTKIAIARAYAFEGVRQSTESLDPQLKPQVSDSQEPGNLEVTTLVLNFSLHQLQEMRMIEEGFNQWGRSQPESSDNRYSWRGPKQFWQRVKQTGIFPLSQDKQAMARLLAFSPIPPAPPVAIQKTETYSIKGRNLETASDSTRFEKYKRFNDELLSAGLGEELLQMWTEADPITARSHAENVAAALNDRIAKASAREEIDDDWQDFIGMLREEAAALHESVRRLPV